MATRRSKKKPERRRHTGPCPFCSAKGDPDYKDNTALSRFVTDRARIVSRTRSGICSKHQRRLSIAIKRSRHLGLLPFKASI